MLRHTLATLAYRGGKAIRGAPADFSGFRAAADRTQIATRTPGQILAHIGDLLEWALKLADGKMEYRETPPQTWEQDSARFFRAPHVGQIGMLRRMAGAPVRGENYFKAEITEGRVGAEQSAPGFEFD
jgi:hypothetical protein